MSRLSPAQAAQFPSGGGRTNFLTLANDGDSAVIRFAYNSMNDIIIDMVHEAQDNQGNRKVIGCLRNELSQPESVCPLCSQGNLLKKTVYLTVYNEDEKQMQVWQRGGGFFSGTLEPLFEEYEDVPLCSVPFKVKRKGAKGDPHTTYSVIPLPVDNTRLEDLGEPIDVVESGILKELSFDEMNTFIQTGALPGGSMQNNDVNNGVQPRNDNYSNFGQRATVESYNQPVNTNRRTINNNGGY